jgi:hypothetical protein
VATRERVVWSVELRMFAVVTGFVTLLGSVVGVVWHALAPQIGIVAAAEGSASAMKALIGDDAWLGLLGALAGVLCVLVLTVVAPKQSHGPGAMLGLAVGGLLAMLVAARVGHLIGHRELTNVLQDGFPGITPKGVKLVLSYFDFSVRATAVLLAWPFASVLVNGLIVWVRTSNEAQPARTSAYPGSS